MSPPQRTVTHRRPDLLRGDFGAARPDEAWVGDISYIRTRQGFLYLAFVLDLASRRVVGISMAPHLKASLATDALREAIATRGGQVRGVVFHTDRGSQYTSEATARLSKAYGIRQSVGRTGVCWDNAAAESFLGTLKKELVNRADYQNRHQARLSNPLVDRSLVQPPPASLHHRTAATKRMGGQLLPSHGRINRVSNSRGELQNGPGHTPTSPPSLTPGAAPTLLTQPHTPRHNHNQPPKNQDRHVRNTPNQPLIRSNPPHPPHPHQSQKPTSLNLSTPHQPHAGPALGEAVGGSRLRVCAKSCSPGETTIPLAGNP